MMRRELIGSDSTNNFALRANVNKMLRTIWNEGAVTSKRLLKCSIRKSIRARSRALMSNFMLSMTSSYLTMIVVVFEDAAVEAVEHGGSWVHTPGGRAASCNSSGWATWEISFAVWFGMSSAISSSEASDVDEEVLGTCTVSGLGKIAPPKVGVRGAADERGISWSVWAGCSSLISDWVVIQLASGFLDLRGGLALP